jgi:hypothetical protein
MSLRLEKAQAFLAGFAGSNILSSRGCALLHSSVRFNDSSFFIGKMV